MRIKQGLLLGITTLTFGGLIAFSASSTVSASNYFPVHHYHTYTPRSWRGTYTNSYGSTMNVNTYSVALDGKQFIKILGAGGISLLLLK